MKFSIEKCGRVAASMAVTLVVVTMTACTTPIPEVKVFESPSYAELMASADEAAKNPGSTEPIVFLERAAKADPAKKQPWLRIAQIQFDARVYGAAITAAQEVLQRDNTDVTAKSILAASGLRVSANALEQLRAVDALGGGTRDEAQALARIMREALGESILPAPVVSQSVAPKPRPVRKPIPRVLPAESASPSTPADPAVKPAPAVKAAPAATTKAPDAPEQKRNPFSALKG